MKLIIDIGVLRVVILIFYSVTVKPCITESVVGDLSPGLVYV